MRRFTASAALLAALPLFAAPVHAQSIAGGATNRSLAAFGASVAISQNDVLVGEPFNQVRTGLVYVYRKTGTRWAAATQIAAEDGKPGDGFGASMTVNGTTLLVGATRQNENKGVVYAFEKSGTAYRQTGQFTAADLTAGDGFGAALAARNDVAVVSAPFQKQQNGAVYVFRRQGSTWNEVAKLVSSEPANGNQFGTAIAFAGDDILVGEPGYNTRTGIVRIFRPDGAGYREAGKITVAGLGTLSGLGAPIAVQNDLLMVGATTAGFVYQFRRTPTGDWREFRRLAPFDAARTDQFGTSVALDGDQVWIGAPGTMSSRGVVYHYWRTGGDSLWSGVERVRAEAPEALERFGSAIASRGDLAVISMVGDDFRAGSVVIFERTAGAWKQHAVLKSAAEKIANASTAKVECNDGKATLFECRDYDLVSFMPITDIGGTRGEQISGNWGWTDPQTGREYALIGREGGTSFVDVTNPEKPVLIGDLPKTAEANPAIWREIKTYKNWALIVSDGAGPHGIQFFDLTRLRNVRTKPAKFEADYIYRDLASIHNIVINEEADMAAAVGANGGGTTCGGGLHMLDIKDPKAPKFLGCFTDTQTGRNNSGYTHDALCVMYRGPDKDYAGREICLNSNETMLSIADVTDKKAPKAVSRAGYPNVGYTHQGWYDAEQRYFYMNDELDESGGKVKNTRTIIWDLADLDDPQVAGEFFGATQAIDHNLYIIGNLMYQSNYVAGLRVIDITDRKNPVEVGFFDTVPHGGNTATFGGSWNNYPFFKSGNIVVSSMAEGMFIVRKKGPKVVS